MRTRTLVPCLLALAGLCPPATRAELVCPAPVFQAGSLPSGKALVHRFALVNRGPQAVEITEVKPGCGCLKAQVDRKSFAPGSTGLVTVEINTVTQAPGPNTWKVTVHGTHAGVPFTLPLLVQANLTAVVSIQPATLVVYTDRAVSHAFTLTEHREAPLTIRAAATGLPAFKTRLAEPAGQAGHWTRRIDLEVLPECPDGRHEDVLHLHTTDPDYPELKVPFTVVKRTPGRVQASPTGVEWLVAGKEALPARVVLLGTGSDEAVEIDRVVPSHACLSCTWASGPGPRATLRIVVDRAALKPGELDGSVEVHLKKPAGGVVTVPVRCVTR
jgi:hypothetical protein